MQLKATGAAVDGAEALVVIVELGTICVQPTAFSDGAKAVDPNSTTQKPKSRRERILDVLWTTYENMADNAAVSVSTDGYSQSFENRETIMAEIRRIEREVYAEKGGKARRLVQVPF